MTGHTIYHHDSLQDLAVKRGEKTQLGELRVIQDVPPRVGEHVLIEDVYFRVMRVEHRVTSPILTPSRGWTTPASRTHVWLEQA
jgi:hypothetical protein